MNRRRFLVSGAAAAALAVPILHVRHGYARTETERRLLNDALPGLADVAEHELQTIPLRGRQEIESYFHGLCLNVNGFITHICSEPFQRLVRQAQSPEEHNHRFLAAFCERLAREDEILRRIDGIATTAGSEIDAAWTVYCTTLSARWGKRLPASKPLATEDLVAQLGASLRDDLQFAALRATTIEQRPALGETLETLGKSAIKLLPLLRLGKYGLIVGVPVFLVLAAKPVWDTLRRYGTQVQDDVQAAMTIALSSLAKRTGSEFEAELRRRVSDLHEWRLQAVSKTSQTLAAERVGFLSGVA